MKERGALLKFNLKRGREKIVESNDHFGTVGIVVQVGMGEEEEDPDKEEPHFIAS